LSMPAFEGNSKPQIAFEFRHESWFREEIYSVLSAHDAALCIAENEDLDTPEVHSARAFACYRLRCPGGYSKEKIAAFAAKISMLAIDKDVFVYFKHEEEPTGALNAVAFRKALDRRAGKR
jgi:uncharacterized protein YecE (DUF72 family)